jgi:YebC/PmpR family DNA-binding regulatory protein
MSGHSKWATTKRQKAVVDAKRGAIFTRIGKLITIAAREKGGDPAANFMLRMAVDKAKAANMPKENIERAIKRGTGELGGAAIEELTYEGFGPAKSQFVVKILTDNKNRSAADIRHLFMKYGGSLGTVAWNFEEKGVIRVTRENLTKAGTAPDELELSLIDAGAQDIRPQEEGTTIYTKNEDLQAVIKFLDNKNIATESAAIEYVAKEELELNGEEKEKVAAFIDELEDNEDVADYFTNAVV